MAGILDALTGSDILGYNDDEDEECEDGPSFEELQMQEIKKRKLATVGEKYAKKYAISNRKKAGEIIDWLVSTKQTSNLRSGVDKEPHSNGWWFNWQKVDQIGDDVTLFCVSKLRMLADGTTIANEAVSNLSKYRTAVKHFIMKAMAGANNKIDWQKVSTCDTILKEYLVRKKRDFFCEQMKTSGKN